MAARLSAFLAAADPADEATSSLRRALAGADSGSHSGSGGRKGGGAGQDEAGYETTPAAARALLRFQAVLRKEPNQGVRYEWGGLPLWAGAQPPPHSSKVPTCPSCGSARKFECQLMPALLFALDVDTCAAAVATPTSGSSAREHDMSPHAPSMPGSPSVPPPPPPVGGGSSEAATASSQGSAPSSAGSDGSDGGDDEAGTDAAADLRALAGASVLARPVALGMDWSSVAVYSCEASCAGGDEEHVVVHPPVN